MDSGSEQAGILKAQEIFEQLCDKPKQEWLAFLETNFAEHPALRDEILDLLEKDVLASVRFDRLESEVIKPGLLSLQSNKSGLEDWLSRHFGKGDDTADPETGRSISHYTLIEVIGQGGMGTVYKAKDLSLNRIVAIKVLPALLNYEPASKERFKNEAQAVSGIDHPNIATVHEVGETATGQMFIVMGYYNGVTLDTMLNQGPVEESRILDYMIQLADALVKVHAQAVIHRDIKPGNLLITEEGVLKLLDFGVAKLEYASGVTQVGQLMGTIAYMAPEQARGQQVDPRTDIWSLGAVLYECLTGQRPFGNEDPKAALNAILHGDPKWPAFEKGSISASLTDIARHCLSKDPDDRYHSAKDLLQDLQRVRDGLRPATEKKWNLWKSGLKGWRVHRVTAILMSVIVVIILLLLNYATGYRTSREYTFKPVKEGTLVELKGNFLGSAWADFDKDGLLDVALTENDRTTGAIHLFRNEGNGQFNPSNTDLFAAETASAGAAYWADPDNDGDLDLLVNTDNDNPTLLFENDGSGSFSKVTDQPWLDEPLSSHASAWGDYDNDGWVDVFLAEVTESGQRPQKLMHNKGNGKFEEAGSILKKVLGDSHGCIWSDYDNDGDLDLFLSGQEQMQFRNDGNGAFSWVGPDLNGIPEYTKDIDVGPVSADYDNDGDFDITWIVWGAPTGVLLYRNELSHSMNDVTHLLPAGDPIRSMAAAWGDYDNDGWLDLFITNSMGSNRLYHNEGNDTFSLVEGSHPTIIGLESCDGQWTDYDNDGDLDLIVANGQWNDFDQSCELYENQGGPNHWLLLTLQGTVSNRAGIGAKISTRATIAGTMLKQHREVQSGGNGNTGSGLRIHFGLGDATIIDTVRIEWPSGILQEIHDVPVDQIMVVKEPDAGSESDKNT